MKGTLERRLLLLCFLALVATIAINTGFSVESFRQQYREGVLRRCQALAAGLKSQVEKVLGLGLPLGEIEGLSERCLAISGNDPELAYCLIESSDGTILFPRDAKRFDPAKARPSGQLGKDVSVLESSELGRVYDLSLPLYDYNDKLAGRIRIGFQEAVLKGLTTKHLLWSLLVLGGVSSAVFILMILFIRRDLVTPVRRMCGVATDLAAGDFNVSLPPLKTSELSSLGDALTRMAGSLRQRDAELRNRYRDLETANEELHQSYAKLEMLSTELGNSREMYRSLLDDASDAILVCNENSEIMIANKSAERFFSLPRIRVEGEGLQAFLDQIGCLNKQEFFSWYQEIQPGQAGDAEVRFLTPSSQRPLVGWVRSSAIEGAAGKRLVQLMVRDATHEEEVRQQLERATRELERLNQMKNSFLGLASHELKTPLTIIIGYVDLLLHEVNTNLDETSKELLQHISRAGERLSEIVRDMVDVSMLDNRHLELLSQNSDINLLLAATAERAQEAVQRRRQKLRLNLSESLPPVRCDQERLVQAFGNILGNAIKFTPDYGLIRISTRQVFRPQLPEKFSSDGMLGVCALSGGMHPYVEIAIMDSGIGIAAEDLETIFEKFYEVGAVEEHSTDKVSFKGRGAGLGLTIAKGVVSLHGGTVWVESPGYDPEQLPGSTFFILLPASEGPALELPRP
jgi:PAS domain S-box-containing protein